MGPELTDAEYRASLGHELTHARRGPVSRALAAREEILVRHETAAQLVPIEPEDRPYTDDELQSMAARYDVDLATVHDRINPPTVPLRAILPMQRADDEAHR